MKIVVVYGNSRKGSTYHCVDLIKRTMNQWGEVEFKEIWLSKDLPEYCTGCFNCILKGEGFCPHVEAVSPIIDSLIEADGIILASPVYGLDVSGAMKTFIDHLCFMWIPHRPNTEMLSKIGFVVSTAAGMGTKRTNNTMKKALDYMGVKRTFTFGTSVAASKWQDVKENKKRQIEKSLTKKSYKFYKTLEKRKVLSERLFTKGMFFIMGKMISTYEDGNLDKKYWRSQGWM